MIAQEEITLQDEQVKAEELKKKAKDLHTSLDLRIQRVDVQEKNLNLAKLERLRFARERA